MSNESNELKAKAFDELCKSLYIIHKQREYGEIPEQKFDIKMRSIINIAHEHAWCVEWDNENNTVTCTHIPDIIDEIINLRKKWS
jgi:hypothetical protein